MRAVNLFLLTPEAFSMVPVYQLLSFRFLDKDMELTIEHFELLSSRITPLDVYSARSEYAANPSIIDKCNKGNPPPLTYQSWVKLQTTSGSDKSKVASVETGESKTFADSVKTPKTIKNARKSAAVSIDSLESLMLRPGSKIDATDPYKEVRMQEVYLAGLNNGQYCAKSGNLPSVVELSTIFQPNQFDLVVYAPPGSGKSTFIHDLDVDGQLYDTDYLPFWTHLNPKVVFTNIPGLIKCGRDSIMFLPSRVEFERRCRSRRLPVQARWYNDLLDAVSDAKQVIRTDKFVNQHAKDLMIPGIPRFLLSTYNPADN